MQNQVLYAASTIIAGVTKLLLQKAQKLQNAQKRKFHWFINKFSLVPNNSLQKEINTNRGIHLCK